MNSNEIIQLFGLLYLIFGLSLLFNKHYYKDIIFDYMESKGLVLLSWIIAFIFWFVILLHFNVWTVSKDWFITLLWWIWLIKWVSLLLFPKFTIKSTIHVINSKDFDLFSFILSILGLYLIYLWYLA